MIQANRQIIFVDTFATLPLPAQLGDFAFAADIRTYASFNGTSWKPMGSANVSPPTVVTGSGAGSGASVSLIGSNTDGLITFTQGTLGVANGQILTLTLADGVTYPNGLAITFSAGNANFAALMQTLYITTTKNSATLSFTGLALGTGSIFKGYYHIGGY